MGTCALLWEIGQFKTIIRAEDKTEHASDSAPATAHLVRNSFFLKTVHSRRVYKSEGRERKTEKRGRYKVRKADKGMGKYTSQHALFNLLVVAPYEHE